MQENKITTGSPEFDTLIGGGLEKKTITQVYGEPASGKSTICLMIAVEMLKAGKKVIFIDTEGFSVERFRQIAGEDKNLLAEDLIIFEPVDFDLQGLMIGECDKILRNNTDVGLIVIDSATALYRVEGGRSGESQRKLGQQMIRLLGFARRYDIPVLVSNQVFMDIDQNNLSGLGGTSLRHISKVIVRLEKKEGFRTAILEKHRSRKEGENLDFIIEEKGIRPISGL
jgi:DNA repair protein RadB